MKAFPKTVIVEPDAVDGRETKTESGIIIQEEQTKREGARVYLAIGTVVSSGVKGITAGEKIGYNPYDSFEFKWNDTTYEAIVETGIRVVL